MGDTGEEGIVLGKSPAGYCFVVRDLTPINFFKWVMIAKLKMRPTVKIFGKSLCQRYQKHLFFVCVVCNQERHGVRHDVCCLTHTSLYAVMLFLKQTSNAMRAIYIFLTFELYDKPILKNKGIYLSKLVTVAYTLNCNVSWVCKHKD